MLVEEVVIEPLDEACEAAMVEIISANMQAYQEAGSVLASTWRRLKALHETYSQPGSVYLTVRQKNNGELIGGAGLGSLASLPPSEGKGEIRDMVINHGFRGRGFGKLLLKECLRQARLFGYQTVYLETTPQMENAQRLFQRYGFRAIRERTEVRGEGEQSIPCYYLLEDIEGSLQL